eukprot:11186-Prymnesium_polylepis.2
MEDDVLDVAGVRAHGDGAILIVERHVPKVHVAREGAHSLLRPLHGAVRPEREGTTQLDVVLLVHLGQEQIRLPDLGECLAVVLDEPTILEASALAGRVEPEALVTPHHADCRVELHLPGRVAHGRQRPKRKLHGDLLGGSQLRHRCSGPRSHRPRRSRRYL